MKIRSRFILAFISLVLLMAGAMVFYVNNILVLRIREEKATGYDEYLEQMVASAVLQINNLEESFFNQYSNRGIASAVLSENPQVRKSLSVENLMAMIPVNIPLVDSVLVVDPQNVRYFTSTLLGERMSVFDSVLQKQEIYNAFTVWVSDDHGEVFLKKDLYQISPLQHAGIIIAHINKQELLVNLGIESRKSNGMLTVVSKTGGLLMESDAAMTGLVTTLLQNENVGAYENRETVINGSRYWLTVRARNDWKIIQLVPVSVMQALSIHLSRFILIGGVAILLLSVILSFVVTHALSKKANALLSSMTEVSRGDFDAEIPVSGHDEIGELAERFRWMKTELKQSTEERIRRAVEKQAAEYEMLELRYRSLQTQISPHFICNVLTTINSLAMMGRSKQVSSLSVKASRYLRDNLNNADHKFHLLSEEIRFVEEYVGLYKDIYEQPCCLTVNWPEEVQDCCVPTMLLQPLVENALVHGYIDEVPEHMLQITVDISRYEEKLILCVTNNGKGISDEVLKAVQAAVKDYQLSKKMTGFGLRSVLQRLRLLYKEDQSLCIRSRDEETMITITIPYVIEAAAITEMM